MTESGESESLGSSLIYTPSTEGSDQVLAVEGELDPAHRRTSCLSRIEAAGTGPPIRNGWWSTWRRRSRSSTRPASGCSISAQDSLKKNGILLVLRRPSPPVTRLLRVVALDEVMTVET